MYPRKSQRLETYDDLLLQGYQKDIDELLKKLPEWATVEVKVNKTELKKQMKDGVTPLGAELVDNWSLIVK